MVRLFVFRACRADYTIYAAVPEPTYDDALARLKRDDDVWSYEDGSVQSLGLPVDLDEAEFVKQPPDRIVFWVN
jgi:hypothetical protein